MVDLLPDCSHDVPVENIPNGAGCTPQDLFNDCIRVCACANQDGNEGNFQTCITGSGGCADLLVELGACSNNGCTNSCTAQLERENFLDECCEIDTDCDSGVDCIIDMCGDDGVCDHFPIPGCM